MAPIAINDPRPVTEAATVHGASKSVKVTKPKFIHALDQLYPEEINEVSRFILNAHPKDSFRFKFITALEPRKRNLVPYLDAFRSGQQPPALPRIASTLYSQRAPGTSKLLWIEALYSLDEHKIISQELVADEFKAQGDPDEVVELEKILLASPKFQAALKKFKLPKDVILQPDPWGYGCDTTDPTRRLVTAMVYYRNPATSDLDSNPYSFPLPICPVMDTETGEIVDIIDAPSGGEADGMNGGTLDLEDPIGHLQASEYMEHLMDQKVRTDLKPYNVVQPEGPSFNINNNRIEWQKWSFMLTFNYREGMVIHDVTYDGRSIAYRMALSEMTVPYGDPRPPFHRKQAFDSGDAGMGLCANRLDLGCDCLGVIKYFDAVVAAPNGEAKTMKNVVCLHEVDDGIQWKHTNYRTDKAQVVRSRQLHIQSIATVSNYEYIWIWKFDQAGAIHFETRATGILSTQYIDKGKKSAFGAVVSPGVMAPNHQHLFSLRMDLAIDGQKNTVLYEDSNPIPIGPDNPHGTAWSVDKTIIKKEGFADANPAANRVFKIINQDKINPISMQPVGYKFTPHPGALMLAHPDSIAFKRAEFGGHHVYVTKYRDDELYTAGNYTYQSSGNAKGILSMIAGEEDVENDDVVLWNTFSLTHNPRIEDWPVMPFETLTVSFKPVNFFTCNPSMDVPRSIQKVNKSVLFDGLQISESSTACCKS